MPQELPSGSRGEAARKEFRLTGVMVLAMFVAFFGVVASVNGYMMRAAISTMPGLDARNGYDVSQQYNERIADAERQAKAGWTADVRLVPGAERLDVLLDLRSPGLKAAPEAVVILQHPAIRAKDVTIPLLHQGAGRYRGETGAVAPGGYTLEIAARDAISGDVVFRSRNRVVVGAPRS